MEKTNIILKDKMNFENILQKIKNVFNLYYMERLQLYKL